MEFEIIQEKLNKALSIVSRVAAGTRATLPILNNVLIRVEGKIVSLTTTNLDMAVVDYLPVTKAKNGVVTVPARLLAEFVSNLPKGQKVKLSAKGTKVTVSAGKYISVINGVLADDFPEMPEIDEKHAVTFKMGIDDFKLGINQVIIASSNDLTRPALTGVYFNSHEGDLYIAATDGYRLTEKKFITKVSSEVAAIVPANSLQEVMRSLDDSIEEIEILFDETQARFRFGEIEITSKLIDGSFPDYRQLIPKNNNIKLNLEIEELIRVIVIPTPTQNLSTRAYSFIQPLNQINEVIQLQETYLTDPDNNSYEFKPLLFQTINLDAKAGFDSVGAVFTIIFAISAGFIQYFNAKQQQPSDKTKKSKKFRELLKEAADGKEPDQADISSAMSNQMAIMMPAMMVVIVINLPGALAFYYFFSSLVTVLQQKVISRQLHETMDNVADKAILKELSQIQEAEVITNKKTGTKITHISKKSKKRRK